MNRIIVDFKKLTPEILNLLVEKFPDGYGIKDVIKFTNPKGQYVEAVEVKTDDTVYLVKISDELVDSMDNHIIDIEDDEDYVSDPDDLDFGEVELEDEDDDFDEE
ncbi:hypothetical protein [Lutibacter sp.]|uniref:hypothetical protein n=1 Tax=Lutibacter sp. TaxID=1925666 RepID=UPI002735C723|nr:hypothetical protein [Lutibacter sp.]MDP3313478.1 hypothetical protein [Lutibacter sp.]